MTILSLFDGISIARVALERAGIPVENYYASEIDKYAIQISQKNYPNIIRLGDVRNVLGKDLPKIDLMILGAPCQDLSIAKKNRQGLSGERSGLFWEAIRIHKEVMPTYFVYENVASMPKESKEQMLQALKEIDPTTEVHMIDAALVSAQRRKRYFFTNIPNITQPEDRGIFLKDILEDGIAVKYNRKKGNQGEIEKSQALCASDWRGINRNQDQTAIYQYRRSYWRETKGGKVPTLTANMGTGGNNVPFVRESGENLEIREATKKGFAIAKHGDAVDMSFPTSATRRGRVGNKVKNIMTSQSIGVVDQFGIRKLTVLECSRLQSLPDSYMDIPEVSNTQKYKALGNGFNAEVITHILKHIPQ